MKTTKIKQCIVKMLLLFLFLVGVSSCKPSHCEYEAKSDVNNLRNAIKAFKIEYGYYPVDAAHLADAKLQTVLPVLLAKPNSEMANKLNTNGVNYLGNIPTRRMNDGAYLDPWGSPFNLMLTTNNIPEQTINGHIVCDNVAIWSNGKNKTNDWGKGDDICSWKTEDGCTIWHRWRRKLLK